MSLDALLTELEHAAVTPVTAAVTPDVTPEPAPILAVTAVTAVTAQNDNAQGATARAWRLNLQHSDPLEVWYAPPATRAEVLADYPEALDGEPIEPTRSCRACCHRRQPGLAEPGYCAGRPDLDPAYGDVHPLRRLPDDGGASCAEFALHWSYES